VRTTSDKELEALKRRKYIEIQRSLFRKAAEAEKPPKKEPSPEEILRGVLTDQGDEVLNAFKAQYPEGAQMLIPILAQAITSGKLRGPIDGGSLYQFLNSLGFRVRIETKIYVSKKGELKELSQYLKEKGL